MRKLKRIVYKDGEQKKEYCIFTKKDVVIFMSFSYVL